MGGGFKGDLEGFSVNPQRFLKMGRVAGGGWRVGGGVGGGQSGRCFVRRRQAAEFFLFFVSISATPAVFLFLSKKERII